MSFRRIKLLAKLLVTLLVRLLVASLLALLPLFLFGCATLSAAQSRNEFAADYSYVRGDAASGSALNLSGADLSLAFAVIGPLGVVADAGVNRTGNVAGSGLNVTICTFMAGPRFSPIRDARLQPSFQVLLGAARASGSAFSAIGQTFGIAVAPGVRLDYSLSRRVSLRLLEADYSFSTYRLSTSRQNGNNREKSVRLGAGIVARF
jgi:hypothetical protein